MLQPGEQSLGLFARVWPIPQQAGLERFSERTLGCWSIFTVPV